MNELLKRKLEFEKNWPTLHKEELEQKDKCLKLWQEVYKGKATHKDGLVCEQMYQRLKKNTDDKIDELININKKLMDISFSK